MKVSGLGNLFIFDAGVMPDTEMEHILRNTFGKQSHPMRKYGRMMYWMPKFKVRFVDSLPFVAQFYSGIVEKIKVHG